MSNWDSRRWKFAHIAARHRVDTWLEVGPWRTPGIEWECVTCRAAEIEARDATTNS